MGTIHNNKVRRIAAGYRAQGFKVRANVPGYPQPLNIGGRRADVVAIHGRNKVLVEVETRKSFASDTLQRRALRQIAKRAGYRFRTVKA